MATADPLMPGPEGKIPKLYEVEKGHKSESYIIAIRGNKVPPPVKYVKDSDGVDAVGPSTSLMEHEPTQKSSPTEEEKCGLNMEELEKYRNDPFWRTLRLILFGLFWAIWILMFLAAFLIVLLSPGCRVIVRPPWWYSAVSYQVWTPSFQDSDGNGLGDFSGVVNRLEKLRRIGVNAVCPMPFLLTDSFSDAVRDHRAVDSKLGVADDAKALIDAAHSSDIKVIIDMPVAVTSTEHEWFLASSQASLKIYANYSSFYQWRKNVGNTDYFAIYKNSNVSYLHAKGKPKRPVLNWQSPAVREHMFRIFSYWIDQGIDGFHLNGIEYLSRISNGSAPNWRAIYDILRDIREHVDTYSKESVVAKQRKIVLYAHRDNANEAEKKAMVASGLDSVVDYELSNVKLNESGCHGPENAENTVFGCVFEFISDILQFHSDNQNVVPMWEFGNPYLSRLATRVDSRDHAELLTMVQLLAPGTSSVYYGEEIGMRDFIGGDLNDSLKLPQYSAMQWDGSDNAGFSTASGGALRVNVHPDYKNINYELQSRSDSQLKMFRILAKLRRRDDTLLMGKSFVGNRVDNAFTLSRFRFVDDLPAGPMYVGAVNLGRKSVILPLRNIPTFGSRKSAEARIVVASSNAASVFYPRKAMDLSSGEVEVPPEQGFVIRLD